MKKYFISLLIFICSCCTLLHFVPVYATSQASQNLDKFVTGELSTKDGGKETKTGFGTKVSPAELVGQVLGIIYSFLGVIALVLIVYAGGMWLFAGGNQDKVAKAIEILRSAVIGLTVIISAYLITAFIIQIIGA